MFVSADNIKFLHFGLPLNVIVPVNDISAERNNMLTERQLIDNVLVVQVIYEEKA